MYSLDWLKVDCMSSLVGLLVDSHSAVGSYHGIGVQFFEQRFKLIFIVAQFFVIKFLIRTLLPFKSHILVHAVFC